MSVPSTPEEPKKSHFAERKVCDVLLQNAKMVLLFCAFSVCFGLIHCFWAESLHSGSQPLTTESLPKGSLGL